MLMESSTADFYTTYNCDLMLYGNTLFSTGLGFASPRGSPIRDHISKAVLELKEDGTIHQLYNKWWDRRRCGKYEEEQAKFDKKKDLPFKAYAVNPRDMAVAFLLLMVGVIAAVVFLVVENVVSRMRTTKFAPGSVQARTHTEDRITGDRIERFSADGDTKPESGDGARGQP
ncbi:glutamate receptor ionotropic, kainate 2-like [Gigantopelta aegis]|uniref:glutamate receptor ionotropic, kainate 2-like n=1 Tax=Gigantopelta aegis TaxID=1735272 RepID=UPI001B88B8EC|nr:glutamate receptor ionotropic, kainate 2-like [Gigantopelta aegis]